MLPALPMPGSPRVVLGMALLLAAAGCGQAKAAVDRVRELVERGDEAEAEPPADDATPSEASDLVDSGAAQQPVAAAMVAAPPRIDAVTPTHAPAPEEDAPAIVEPEPRPSTLSTYGFFSAACSMISR